MISAEDLEGAKRALARLNLTARQPVLSETYYDRRRASGKCLACRNMVHVMIDGKVLSHCAPCGIRKREIQRDKASCRKADGRGGKRLYPDVALILILALALSSCATHRTLKHNPYPPGTFQNRYFYNQGL